jgi:signal transduction histidine kinase/CheY-like chemotaxis protein
MSAIETTRPAARPTFESILEQLYTEYKRLEIEHRKLAEYKKLFEEYRVAEEARRQEDDSAKLAEYTRLHGDFVNLEAAYRLLDGEYKKLAERSRQQEELRSFEEEKRARSEAELAEGEEARLELENRLRAAREQLNVAEKEALVAKARAREAEEGAARLRSELDAASVRQEKYEEESRALLERLEAAERTAGERQGEAESEVSETGAESDDDKAAASVVRHGGEFVCPYHNIALLLLDSCSDAIFVLDGDMKVTLATTPAVRMIGAPDLPSVEGRDFEGLVSAIMPDAEFGEKCRAVMKDFSASRFSCQAFLPDGDVTFDCTLSPTSGDGGVVILLHDVTEFDMARRHAEDASRSKSSFLATVSHEIRTPLNAVLGLSEIEMQKDLPRATMDNLERIYGSGASLLGIINDILDISKIEAGSMEIIPTNYTVSGLMSSAIQLNLVRIGSKDISFDLDMDPNMPERLYGDELRVKQILNNLLSNAFKYTEEGSVKLTVEWEQEGDSVRMTFIVSDTGQGIRAEDLGKLFSEYKQVNARANRYIEGTGLGLSITKKLTELMDGSISVESEFGSGSSFTVSLMQKIVDLAPVGEDAIKNLKEFRFAEYRNKMKKNLIRSYMPYGKVLVVDDVPTNLEVARGLLLPYGLTIDCVEGGPEAIDRVRAAGSPGVPYYDLVLMDHMMPVMDGVEATKVIRELGTDYSRSVPVIALTANAMAGVEEMFLRNGFNGFISKPIDIMRLDVELNKWIRGKQGEAAQMRPEPPKPSASEISGPAAETSEPADITILPGESLKLDAKSTARASASPVRLSADVRADGRDIAEGLERYGDEEIYVSVLRTYADSTPQILNKMRIISIDKLPEYAIMIHGIKGSSYGICAQTAGKWAERLEMAAKRGELETVLSENSDFIKMTERLIASISAILDGPESKSTGGITPKAFSPDRTALERLLIACKQFDVNAMDQYLMELEGYDYEYGGDLVTWLRSKMDNQEYDAIQEQLTRSLTSSRKH